MVKFELRKKFIESSLKWGQKDKERDVLLGTFENRDLAVMTKILCNRMPGITFADLYIKEVK